MEYNTGLASGVLTAFAFGIIGCALLNLTKTHRRTLRLQIALFAVALAVRFFMSVAIYQGGLINILKDEDGGGWIKGAEFVRDWGNEGIGFFQLPQAFFRAYSEQNRGYWYLLGVLFYMTEAARLPAAAFNCFIGSLVVVFTYRVAETLFTPSIAKRVGLWLCFFPSMILWSSQTIKEPIVILLEVLAVYGCVRVRESGFSLLHLLLCTACIVLVVPFRFYASYVMIAAVVFASIVPKVGRGGFNAGPILGGLMIAAILTSTGFMAGREKEAEQYDLDYIQKFRSFAVVGEGSGSSVRLDVDIRSSDGMGIALFVGAAHLFLAPFPWQFGGGLRVMMVAPEMLFYWWLFFWGVIPGLFSTIRTRFNDVLPILIFLAGFGMLYSLMFTNVGLVYRQRAQLLPWLAVFAGVGVERRKLRRASVSRPPTSPAPHRQDLNGPAPFGPHDDFQGPRRDLWVGPSLSGARPHEAIGPLPGPSNLPQESRLAAVPVPLPVDRNGGPPSLGRNPTMDRESGSDSKTSRETAL